jgi:tRNA (guanine-N7-)-methyltransferase
VIEQGPAPVSPTSVRRPAVTFKVRRRALSPARQARLDSWMAAWGVDETGDPIDWATLFAGTTDVILDIGFGHGESTVVMAAADPATGIVGIEVHTPGVATMLHAVADAGLVNVRIVHGDALVFLDRIRTESVAGVRIYFPDPWPKGRQHHRRIVRADVVAALTDRLRVGATLHFATDIVDYADAMQRTCDDEPRLTGGVIDRPSWRPLTRFERRGLDEGRHPVDLLYRRTS